MRDKKEGTEGCSQSVRFQIRGRGAGYPCPSHGPVSCREDCKVWSTCVLRWERKSGLSTSVVLTTRSDLPTRGSQERPLRGGHEGGVHLARWRWWVLAAGWLESRSVRRASLAKAVEIAWGCLQVEVDLTIGPQLAMT